MFFDRLHFYEMPLSRDIDLNWGRPLASLVWLQFCTVKRLVCQETFIHNPMIVYSACTDCYLTFHTRPYCIPLLR